MESRSDVKLLSSYCSPFSKRVQLVLKLKRIKYTCYDEEPFQTKSNLLLKSNPVHKKVPVLIHGRENICESLVIVQYIDETWPNVHPILPSDPFERADVRFWGKYIDNKLVPAVKKLLLAEGAEKIAVKEQIDEVMMVLEEAFLKCSKGKAYFGGDNIGYIDIVLGSCLVWIKAMEDISGLKVLEKVRTPELLGWSDTFMSNDAVKDVDPESGKFVTLLRKIKAKSSFKPRTSFFFYKSFF